VILGLARWPDPTAVPAPMSRWGHASRSRAWVEAYGLVSPPALPSIARVAAGWAIRTHLDGILASLLGARVGQSLAVIGQVADSAFGSLEGLANSLRASPRAILRELFAPLQRRVHHFAAATERRRVVDARTYGFHRAEECSDARRGGWRTSVRP